MPFMAFDGVRTAMDNFVTEVGGRLEAQGICERKHAGLLLAAATCALLPLELSHLISMFVGILAYMLLQAVQPKVTNRVRETRQAKGTASKPVHPWRAQGLAARRSGNNSSAVRPPPGLPNPEVERPRSPTVTDAQKAEVRRPSAMPVAAPTFQSIGWDEEVKELLGRIAPTHEGDAAVDRIARSVQRLIAPILPEADVAGYAGANILGGTAFGVAVPEVDIVINLSPAVLFSRLQGRFAQGRSTSLRIDEQKIQKSAIRTCTDRLVSTGHFKFRRSAFRGLEPKVTVIAPVGWPCTQGVPVNLSVNATTPRYNAMLLAEAGRLQPEARELALLVRRWAKDRGLCHAAKGHLSPYAWTLLVVFFFQVDTAEGSPLLPPLEGFESCSSLKKVTGADKHTETASPVSRTKRSVGQLFKDFLEFYVTVFDWHREAISVRFGRRGEPDRAMPLHIVLDSETGSSEVGPSVEDPFEPGRNLGACITAPSLAHLRGELQRAKEMGDKGASLSELLEPWAPPEAATGQGGEEHDDEH